MVAIVGNEHIAVVVKLDILGIIEEGIFNRTVTESAAAVSLFSRLNSLISDLEYTFDSRPPRAEYGLKRQFYKP